MAQFEDSGLEKFVEKFIDRHEAGHPDISQESGRHVYQHSAASDEQSSEKNDGDHRTTTNHHNSDFKPESRHELCEATEGHDPLQDFVWFVLVSDIQCMISFRSEPADKLLRVIGNGVVDGGYNMFLAPGQVNGKDNANGSEIELHAAP